VFNLLLHNLSSFSHYLSSGHLLLHKSQALIFLEEACQFILDDCFDLFFRVLLLVFLSFDLLGLDWLLSAWRGGVPS
jgi:hypothetical protein